MHLKPLRNFYSVPVVLSGYEALKVTFLRVLNHSTKEWKKWPSGVSFFTVPLDGFSLRLAT